MATACQCSIAQDSHLHYFIFLNLNHWWSARVWSSDSDAHKSSELEPLLPRPSPNSLNSMLFLLLGLKVSPIVNRYCFIVMSRWSQRKCNISKAHAQQSCGPCREQTFLGRQPGFVGIHLMMIQTMPFNSKSDYERPHNSVTQAETFFYHSYF